jgi:hypothetical protein
MPQRGKCSTTSVFRALRNRRFHSLGRLSIELRRYWELIDRLPVIGGRTEALRSQLALVRRASEVYEKHHSELLAYLEQHPEIGLPAAAARLANPDLTTVC